MENSDKGVLQFYVKLDAEYGINFNASIKPKYQAPATILAEDHQDTSASLRTHPDLKSLTWVGDQLKIIMPRLPTDFWHHEATQDAERKLDAELKLLFTKKKIDKANKNISEPMEIEGEGKLVIRAISRD